MFLSKELTIRLNTKADLAPQALFIAFVVAVFLLPCLSYGQWFPKHEFDVLNTETLKLHPARYTKKGELRVYDEVSMLSSQIVDEQNSKFKRFTVLNHILLREQSIIKTKNAYHQVDQVIRTSSGEIYIQGRTLFDKEDKESYYRSPKGTFLHKTLIPIHSILAYQSTTTRCDGVGEHYVKSEDREEATEWAQAILVNQQVTLEEDKVRRESLWGTTDIRYMKKVACLSNGEIILSEKQVKKINMLTLNKEYETDIFEVIKPSGESTLAYSPGQYWQTAAEVKNQNVQIWAQSGSDLEDQRQRASQ